MPPVAPLTIDQLQAYIGETVYDPYGRVLGKLVSLDSDVDGVVTSIALEDEKHSLSFIPASSVRIESGKIVVLPEWKVLANNTLSSYATALKRVKGLEDMYSRNEIPSQVYRELRKKLDASLSRLKEESKKLREKIRKRMGDLEDENLKLERAIANLKVSYFAGEISEKSYKIAIDFLRKAKDSNAKELDDLRAVLKKIESLESGLYEAKHETREHAKEEEKGIAQEEAEIPSVQPIPVKIISG